MKESYMEKKKAMLRSRLARLEDEADRIRKELGDEKTRKSRRYVRINGFSFRVLEYLGDGEYLLKPIYDNTPYSYIIKKL